MNVNVPATNQRLNDLLDEYEDKFDALPDEVKAYNDACAAMAKAKAKLEMAATVKGVFAKTVINNGHFTDASLKQNLLMSGWMAIYNYLQIDRIASAKDKKRFQQAFEKPPELTFENVKATFGDYFIRPRYHILRGLAEAFVDLDPAYKSHSKVKIGVKGLPKRVIITWSSYGSYGQDKFRDIANALAAYQNIDQVHQEELVEIDACFRAGKDAVLDGTDIIIPKRYGQDEEKVLKVPNRGLTVKKYMNGNAHIIFSAQAALDINRALAEFYGEVLPDVEEDGEVTPKSTAVSKDLQFYGSPSDVVDRMMSFAGVYDLKEWSGRSEKPHFKFLEPSCGDGRIMDGIKARGHNDIFGIEYHAVRAHEARSKGHAVLTTNFLEHPSMAEYDYVLMNPPFVNVHWMKHVRHALDFVKENGVLCSILPATARYDHDFKIDGYESQWQDLPVGSFSEVGTNVPTILLKIVKRKR